MFIRYSCLAIAFVAGVVLAESVVAQTCAGDLREWRICRVPAQLSRGRLQ